MKSEAQVRGVCEEELSPSIYSWLKVVPRGIFLHLLMQPPWRDHQRAPRGRPRRLAQPRVCGHTQVESPRDRLLHGGLLMGLGRVYVGFVPRCDR